MEIYKEGDKSRAICPHCKKQVSTTFLVRNAKIHDGSSDYNVPNVLVGVCDICDRTVSVPQQSFAAVGEVRKKAERESLEVRLPRHLLDVINMSISSLGIEVSSDLRGQLLKIYIASSSIKEKARLRSNLDSDLLQGKFSRDSRLSMKITSHLDSHVDVLVKGIGLGKTDLMDVLIVKMKNELLDKKNKSRAEEVRQALIAG